VKMMRQRNQLVMTLGMGEPLQLSQSLLADPSVADRVASTDPPASGHRGKRPPSIPKRKQSSSSADQVMTHIEIPPYRGP
jgi:hypothetical protein